MTIIIGRLIPGGSPGFGSLAARHLSPICLLTSTYQTSMQNVREATMHHIQKLMHIPHYPVSSGLFASSSLQCRCDVILAMVLAYR